MPLNVDIKAIQKQLEPHFYERVATPLSDYRQIGRKAKGFSTGFKIESVSDNSISLVKYMTKMRDVRKLKYTHSLKNKFKRCYYLEAADFITEFITSDIYRRGLLFDRSSTFELIADQSTPDVMMARSKFLYEFEEAMSLYERHGGKLVPKKRDALLEGGEKFFTSCWFGAEADYKPDNFGFKTDEDGQRVLAKIDHGRSGLMVFTDESILRKNFASMCKLYSYTEIFNLSPSLVKSSIDQALLNLSDLHLKNIIKARVSKLRGAGLDPRNLLFNYYLNYPANYFEDKDSKNAKKYVTNNDDIDFAFRNLETFFIENFRKQRKTMQKLSCTMGIISQISPLEPNEWIDKLQGEDPVAWAAKEDKQIDGMSSVKWALDNDYEIEGQYPILWAIENGCNIEDQDSIAWAWENGYEIEGKDPIIWALNKGFDIEDKDPIAWAWESDYEIEDQDPIAWAVEKRLKIDGKDPIAFVTSDPDYTIEDINPVQWALDKGHNIEGMNPITWAVRKSYYIDDVDPILWCIKQGHQIEGRDPVAWAKGNCFDTKDKDPVLLAIDSDYKIEGLCPVEWAIRNNELIDGTAAIVWASIDDDFTIDGMSPVKWAVINNYKVDEIDAVEWALENDHKIDGQDIIIWCVKNDYKIDGLDPIIYFIENGYKIEGKNPITWAIAKGHKIDGVDPRLWAVINHRDPDSIYMNMLQSSDSSESTKTIMVSHSVFLDLIEKAKVPNPDGDCGESVSSSLLADDSCASGRVSASTDSDDRTWVEKTATPASIKPALLAV